MVHQVTCFTDALLAWENWNFTSFDTRCEHLLSLKYELEQEKENSSWFITYHLEHASALLAQPYGLVGPTGESNELYTAGRGVALIIQEEQSQAGQSAAVAQIVCALVAGNSVIVCSDDHGMTTALHSAVQQASLPVHLLQLTSLDAYQTLIESEVGCVGYVGHRERERRLNRQLAKRSGAVINLISETDFIQLPTAHDPHLSLRFITERTRTINITAVGGNATLLELGSESH
ncbi:1-pyrroline-5-carboxylate dehydrogenase [Vibrio cincinnatiensis]|jgi:delta 1-pyrroline-5-carboxylate dehydrogenase|uniref:Delta-1-pyrroline-5-carboxylate dehydrogenase n=1 Tax=Vibrio cincinnatiensis DSM 19608 TaxID=1123491 RepID=A0A1T4NL19_VIBCI|nr:1-pyrroline-5-carboxylate dehydrogenase [Vibrio cincinnatiensis]MCG3721008.1 1-pyrroline-5-carboxylate dehydrogenase [Vibrio cincinnatiensis]MCG3724942.1 1-pyrroline-5-carboxylate dehydrogenase [Vibrio cincinnatiensis]MCG3732380.1 1-pyrroline-5-carboxylate dehydrogenase [Vibrio cincinnatiensis]MCG3735585.1 1-pyrroline-5-carboxylate dehydrogenase [Vibrio cincinnatiensis]MCG3738999.1 1-pyrroline-5-carboxylate dehydrogenase [Vibrio cincinnatiensis]